MRQAGRYLPEYRALRAKADFLTCCRTPALACEITLQPVRRLEVDAAILFSDILVPLPAMGVEVTFNPGPHLTRPVRSAGDVAALRVPDAREATPFVLDAIRMLRRELPQAVPLIGFAGAPFTMATYLVEGGGSKQFEAIKGMLFSDPATAHALLACCADTVASLLSEQVRAGAQAAMLFDTWAGLLGPADYRVFALPYVRRVFDCVADTAAALGVDVPRIYYAGNAAGWLPACRETGATWLASTGAWTFNPRGPSSDRCWPCRATSIRLSCSARRTSSATARARCSTQAGPVGHIFNLGHGILPQTPPDHARMLVDAVRESSSRRVA